MLLLMVILLHLLVHGDTISFNLSTSRIDPINFIVDERGEKVNVIMKKKQKAEWELN